MPPQTLDVSAVRFRHVQESTQVNEIRTKLRTYRYTTCPIRLGHKHTKCLAFCVMYS